MDWATLYQLSPANRYLSENEHLIIGAAEEDRRESFAFALQQFSEAFTRLSFRNVDYHDASQRIAASVRRQAASPRKPEEGHFLQLKVVDRLEAFHQQAYACLSLLVAVLNEATSTRPPRWNISTNSGFLDQLRNAWRYQSQALKAVDSLDHSVSFRSKFVDHPQQNKSHNWLTSGYGDRQYVVYYRAVGNEVRLAPGHPDPLHPAYRPPVSCGDDFFVAPHPADTFETLYILTRHALPSLLERRRRGPDAP